VGLLGLTAIFLTVSAETTGSTGIMSVSLWTPEGGEGIVSLSISI
jgi:hypothetical protein